ncbi:hypothetical protein OH77DRAFT_191109 [Trametes cingulata]|nr:hypothetical protein OH77DRAFT_191109 [Trametes cingulata]
MFVFEGRVQHSRGCSTHRRYDAAVCSNQALAGWSTAWHESQGYDHDNPFLLSAHRSRGFYCRMTLPTDITSRPAMYGCHARLYSKLEVFTPYAARSRRSSTKYFHCGDTVPCMHMFSHTFLLTVLHLQSSQSWLYIRYTDMTEGVGQGAQAGKSSDRFSTGIVR